MQGQTIKIILHDGEEISIDNVLIEPKHQEDIAYTDTDTDPVAYRLHIPKDFISARSDVSLSHARCVVYGDTYRVLGNPKPYMAENTPTEWIMPVDVGYLGYEQSFILQKAYFSQNEKGDSLTQWIDLAEIPCRVLETTQDPLTERAKVESENTLFLICDWHISMEGLNSTNARAVYDNKTYTIKEFRNVTHTNDVVRLEVECIE